MLKKILSGDSCAQCRLCCVFDRYDVWETPVFTEEIRRKILEAKPGTEFISKDGGYIFKAEELGQTSFSPVPHLPKQVVCWGTISRSTAAYGPTESWKSAADVQSLSLLSAMSCITVRCLSLSDCSGMGLLTRFLPMPTLIPKSSSPITRAIPCLCLRTSRFNS